MNHITVSNQSSLPPFTIEHLLHRLRNDAAKWRLLGKALSLHDDCLDEIYTNNSGDEACLTRMLEIYLTRTDLNHTWEEISRVLRRIKETNLSINSGSNLYKLR